MRVPHLCYGCGQFVRVTPTGDTCGCVSDLPVGWDEGAPPLVLTSPNDDDSESADG